MRRVRDPDAEHDERLQRDLDAEMDLEQSTKRDAAAMSAEQLLLRDAFLEGQRAGDRNEGTEMNPHGKGTMPGDAWEHGRRNAQARNLAAQLRRAALMRQCVGCTCGGRGLCRDAA